MAHMKSESRSLSDFHKKLKLDVKELEHVESLGVDVGEGSDGRQCDLQKAEDLAHALYYDICAFIAVTLYRSKARHKS